MIGVLRWRRPVRSRPIATSLPTIIDVVSGVGRGPTGPVFARCLP